MGEGLSKHIDSFIHDSLLVSDVGELKKSFLNFLAAVQIDIVAYQYLTAGFKKLSLEEGFRISTFPEGFIKYYLDNNWAEKDPVLEAIYKNNVPFTWGSLLERDDLKAQYAEYVGVIRQYGLVDGIAVPVYAMPGDIAYFSLGSSIAKLDFTHSQLLELQALCQLMHARYNELSMKAKLPVLSKREAEVLELIARGKANTAISEALGVSPNTVDTLIRRCFEKLGVTSRVEAVLAGVSMGLILP